ncbi:hypothetical protein L2E82_28409 [Cichorium intybus]|uniref:Uncharacterized protein n=1 Tax=Cichorium intybus TaxID=13427 RepID=A0ACB9CVY5_CICIN|nr:hypothetical protein L2E82_28409 [Cichorium intybus]
MYFLGRQDACLFHSSATASSLLTFASSESISLAICFLTTLAHPLSITSPVKSLCREAHTQILHVYQNHRRGQRGI